MALVKKDTALVKADLAEGFADGGVTNFNPGGVANTAAEAIGGVVGKLYSYGEACVLSGLASNATGEWLDRKVQERRLTRLAAVKTIGTVYFGRNVTAGINYFIPTGTMVSTRQDLAGNRWRFVTTQDYTLAAGEKEVACEVEAETVGEDWNVAVGGITLLTKPVAGIDWVENRTGWITQEGADLEDDAHLRNRYFLAWDALTTGSTAAAYLLWAYTADVRVKVAWIDCNFPRGEGTINIYILGAAGLPTQDLIDAVQEYIGGPNSMTGKKPAGDDVLVLAPAYLTVPLTFKLVRYANTDAVALEATTRAALTAYFNPLGSDLFSWIRPLGVGKTVKFAQLVEICMRPDEVYDVGFTDPLEDVPVSAFELPVLGTMTITHEEVVP